MKRIGAIVTGVVAVLLVASPVRGQEIDPALKADIEKLFDVTGMSTLGPRLASALITPAMENLRLQQPAIPDGALAIVKDVFTAEIAHAFDADSPIHADLVRTYAKYFTREDLSALLTFYNTDAGRKAITVMPQLAQDGAAAAQRWAVTNMPRIMGVVQQRLRAEGLVK